jgi:hypothetical protein
MTDHPGIARVAIGRIPLGPNALRMSETILALLAAGGVGPQESPWALDLLGLYATAVAFENGIFAATGTTEGDFEPLIRELQDTFATLPAARFPLLRAMAGHLTAGSGDERERFGIEVLINGLLATAARPPAS